MADAYTKRQLMEHVARSLDLPTWIVRVAEPEPEWLDPSESTYRCDCSRCTTEPPLGPKPATGVQAPTVHE